jgi:putative ABC transport system permease protein
METIIQDLRYSLRTIFKSPGFAVIAVLTLAVGIGANTAIFSVVQAALLRSLPYKDVDRIVYVSETNPESTARVRQGSYPDYLDWKQTSGFQFAAGYGGAGFFVGTESPERIFGGRITADFFKVLGVEPVLGRHFTVEEENGQGSPVIVTHGFWRRRMGSDPNVIGRPLVLSGMVYTIAGVLPEGFHFAPLGPADVWVPLNPSAPQRERRYMHWLYVIARLKDGVTMEGAQPELTAIGERVAQLDSRYHEKTSVRIGPIVEPILGNVRPIVLGLFAAVGLVLLIACVNVANLVLARSAARRKEVALRVALGANRRRLIQQLLTETLLLSAIGGILGILIAQRSVPLLIAGIPDALLNQMPFLARAGLDTTVLAFTAGAAILTGILCGLLPALQPPSNIRGPMAPANSIARHFLVVSEVAVALVLLIAAGLLMKSMVRLLEVDAGFKTENLITMRITLLGERYRDNSQRQSFFDRVLSGVETLPGVSGASGVDILPLSAGGNTAIPTIEGDAEPNEMSANVRTIFPNYFEAMGIPLITGRRFSDRDTMNSPMVVMVNRRFVSSILKGQDAIGKRMTFAFTPNEFFEITGVADDENVTALDTTVNPVIYFPYAQGPPSSMGLVIRTTVDPASVLAGIRSRILDVDPTAAILGVRTMEELIAISPYAFSRRYPAILIGLFAAIALLLAVIGIYGVIAFSVTQRTREMGVRMALGAQRGDVFRLILREGVFLGGMGIGIGLLVAAGVTRFMSSLLFGVTATDPAVFGSVAAVFMAVTLFACYVPARRATQVDPLVALREE